MRALSFLLKNPVLLIIPAILFWIFATGAIIPFGEISALIPIMLIAGAVAYYEKDWKLLKLWWVLFGVGGVMGISFYVNSGIIMKEINPHRFKQMYFLEISEWKYGFNKIEQKKSFYKKNDLNNESTIEWF